MERYYVNPVNPNARYLRKAANILNDGGLVAYPTDTSYGIGCLLSSNYGVKDLNDLSGRLGRSLLHTMICHSFSEVSKYAVMENAVFRMMKKLLPGPYTFILGASGLVPKVCQTKRRTIGVRLSENAVVRDLLDMLDAPLLNLTALPDKEERVLDDPDEIERLYKHEIDVLLDIGAIPSLLTTVIDCSGDTPVVVRQGAGPVEE